MEKKNVVDELLWEYIWFDDVGELLKIRIKNYNWLCEIHNLQKINTSQ
jgi:hypothetical protein